MARLDEEYSTRLNKKKTAQEQGINAYPARVKRTHVIKKVLGDFGALAKKKAPVSLVGRIRTIRLHGGSCFAHIEDDSAKLQLYFKRDSVGKEQYKHLKNYIDIGDFIEVAGTLFTTKKG